MAPKGTPLPKATPTPEEKEEEKKPKEKKSFFGFFKPKKTKNVFPFSLYLQEIKEKSQKKAEEEVRGKSQEKEKKKDRKQAVLGLFSRNSPTAEQKPETKTSKQYEMPKSRQSARLNFENNNNDSESSESSESDDSSESDNEDNNESRWKLWRKKKKGKKVKKEQKIEQKVCFAKIGKWSWCKDPASTEESVENAEAEEDQQANRVNNTHAPMTHGCARTCNCGCST